MAIGCRLRDEHLLAVRRDLVAAHLAELGFLLLVEVVDEELRLLRRVCLVAV